MRPNITHQRLAFGHAALRKHIPNDHKHADLNQVPSPMEASILMQAEISQPSGGQPMWLGESDMREPAFPRRAMDLKILNATHLAEEVRVPTLRTVTPACPRRAAKSCRSGCYRKQAGDHKQRLSGAWTVSVHSMKKEKRGWPRNIPVYPGMMKLMP
jgi:hypothetical protein